MLSDGVVERHVQEYLADLADGYPVTRAEALDLLEQLREQGKLELAEEFVAAIEQLSEARKQEPRWRGPLLNGRPSSWRAVFAEVARMTSPCIRRPQAARYISPRRRRPRTARARAPGRPRPDADLEPPGAAGLPCARPTYVNPVHISPAGEELAA